MTKTKTRQRFERQYPQRKVIGRVGTHVKIREAGERFFVDTVHNGLFLEVFLTHHGAMAFCRDMKFVVEFEETGGKP